MPLAERNSAEIRASGDCAEMTGQDGDVHSRLTAVAPDLVARLESRPEVELRNIAAVVAREVVLRTGLNEPLVASALGQIGAEDADRTSVDLHALAARRDEVAWEIQGSDDAHDSESYLKAFARARAASAVAFALDPESGAAHESIYEAQAALGSMDDVRRIMQPRLADR